MSDRSDWEKIVSQMLCRLLRRHSEVRWDTPDLALLNRVASGAQILEDSAVSEEFDVDRALWDAVGQGLVEIASVDEKGEPSFRLTAAGNASADEMIRGAGMKPEELSQMSFRDFYGRLFPQDVTNE